MDSPIEVPTLKVEDLLSEAASALDLRLIAGGAGLSNTITAPQIQKPGLALAGFFEYLHPGRVQILGRSEVEFLGGLTEDRRRQVIARLASSGPACFVVTRSLPAPVALLEEADRRAIPLLGTDRLSAEAIEGFHRFLEERLAPFTSLHGVLVDVYGLGVLLLGDSGVGKSECALDLIQRGHRLVADDVVEIRKYPNGSLAGRAAEMIRYHMELRGIGIINIKHLFGVSAVRTSKSIELVIELERWDPAKKYDRLGLDGETYSILDRPRPFLRLPVASGRNIALLIEIAARNELLKTQGYDAAKEFALKVDEQIAKNAQSTARRR